MSLMIRAGTTCLLKKIQISPQFFGKHSALYSRSHGRQRVHINHKNNL